ncbi:ferritin-like domain-containing protein [Agaribacter flavus]|uniref:Ferritin-like protein n=1 Tax=Agaribacter flavus TaxID=1902781 RepID=A0ABV7FNT8_9ALTE
MSQNTQALRQAIQEKLQTAITLELSTLPPYLTAYFSICPNTNIKATEAIRSVFMEEMLHLCLAANVLVSIGGTVSFSAKTIPQYPCVLGFKGREFNIDLARFSRQSVNTFRRIELPDYMPPLDESLHEKENVSVSGYSIGEFYNSILDDLHTLHDSCISSKEALFIADASKQITETYFWRGGGKPIAVVDMDTARAALKEIIEQGEGTHISLYDNDNVEFGQTRELAHFFKFNEIYYEREYEENDDPLKPPSGKKFAVSYGEVYPLKTNCKQSDFADNEELAQLNHKFNMTYTLMLKQIEDAYAGNPHVLYNAIMNGMHDLSPIARTMAKIKIDPNDPLSETGAPSFEWVQPLEIKETKNGI